MNFIFFLHVFILLTPLILYIYLYFILIKKNNNHYPIPSILKKKKKKKSFGDMNNEILILSFFGLFESSFFIININLIRNQIVYDDID